MIGLLQGLKFKISDERPYLSYAKSHPPPPTLRKRTLRIGSLIK